MGTVPSVGLVLEPGIDCFDDRPAQSGPWDLHDLPHAPTVGEGPERTLSVRTFASTPLLVLDGALSLHEGGTPQEVVFPVRVLAQAGVDTLLFVNTSGSVDPVIEPGSLALVSDHINFQGANPLVGPNVEAWGPRFPDMTEAYDAGLRRAAEAAALQHGIKLHEGIYFAMLGPSAGTQAEYRMVQSLGANLVGTGTVPEVIAARHMGVRVLCLSVVTRQCLLERGRSPEEDESTEVWARLQTLLPAVVSEEMGGTDAKA